METVTLSNAECVIAGDFNIDLLKTDEKPLFDDFLHSILSHSFLPKITLPTRFGNSCATLIDNVLCRLSAGYSSTTAGVLMNKISDHQPCFVCLPYLKRPMPNPKTITISTRRDNYLENVKNEVLNFDLMSKLNRDVNVDPNTNVQILQDCIASAVDKNTITKTVKLNKHKTTKSEWIIRGILLSIRYRDN